jgi:DNA-binding response OmpR family regulator
MTLATHPTKAKVLAVDDDKDLLNLLEKVLERAGYEVGVASDGPEALDYLEAERPDFMVLDLTMPHMDGLEVLERLQNREHRPRVVCLTGRSESERRLRAWRLGVDEYVTKPFGIDQIVEVLNDVARRDWTGQESRRQRALDDLSWT